MSGIDKLMKMNCSTIFLLNPLGLEKKRLDKIGFIGAYLKDEYNQIEYRNPVFLLFKPVNIHNFQTFIENEYGRINSFTGTKDLKADYDRGDGEIVLVYEFPFSSDYQKFMKGEYSKFSEEIIKTYPKTITVEKEGKEVTLLGVPYRIITKDEESEDLLNEIYGEAFLAQQPVSTLAQMISDRYQVDITEDMELWSLPTLEKETLRYGRKESHSTIKE